MRPLLRYWATAAAALVACVFAANCSGIDTPAPPNGPSSQSFSTNNALIRVVNGSPTAGSACVVGGQATTCVDVYVDGKPVALGVPYPTIPALVPFAVLPYISVPSGPALVQIYQSGTSNLVFEPVPSPAPSLGAPQITLSANKKYSLVLAGNAPIAPEPFFPAYLFADGLFNSQFGQVMGDFHNASPNAGSQQFEVVCNACPAGGEKIGSSAVGPGSVVGPVNMIPSGGYTLGTTTKQIPASQINGTNTGNVLPDPFGKPNVNIYLIDTLGGSGSFQVIGVEDRNG